MDDKNNVNHEKEISFLVITCGDDQEICLIQFFLIFQEENFKLFKKKVLKIPTAHNASITKISIKDNSFIFSSGSDQRLNIWKIEYNNKSENYYLIDKIYLFSSSIIEIADISSLDINIIIKK